MRMVWFMLHTVKHIYGETHSRYYKLSIFLPSSVPYRFIDTKMKVIVCKENTVSSKQSET